MFPDADQLIWISLRQYSSSSSSRPTFFAGVLPIFKVLFTFFCNFELDQYLGNKSDDHWVFDLKGTYLPNYRANH